MSPSHDFSTPLLRVFTEVARLGSFTAAGRVLGYTQSAVSRQVSALEEEAGAVLFDRLARGVRPTEAGRRLLPHAQAVLERLDAARRELLDLRSLATGRLRVGAFATADASLVPHAIAAFRRAHPAVELTLREGLTAELVDLLLAGAVDVGVISLLPAGADRLPEGLELHRLRDDPMLVAVPNGHRLAGRQAVALADLADEEWIAGSADPGQTLIASCLRSGFRPRIGFVASDWMAKQGFVAAGLGITLIPSLAAAAVRPDITVLALDPQDVPPRHVYAATARELTPSPAAHAFLTLLRGHTGLSASP
ncbi:LysR family transcriptional regulator [Kitasatospora nipponensis]|uniref:LysR family transcriptional regulator n=1 Tax=Kitasatospora nipponensis TaxID=258049 RepID=A0ABN1WV01_9ACTN